ncbi:ATP-binding protein [bacterium]|nr:ATP-binding protein [bacterium]
MMKQYKYSTFIFFILIAIFNLGRLLSAQQWGFVDFLALLLVFIISYGFYVFLEKRIVQLSKNIDSKRSSDIRIRHLGRLRKFFSGSLLDVESKVHKLKKTQRKIIDDLAEEKDKLSAILLQMVDGVMMLDEEDKVLFYNPACKKILGIEQQHSMQGAFVGEVVFRPQILEAIQTLKVEQKPIEEHIQFFDKGKAKYVYVQMRSLGLKGKSKILISLQDVSKDKTLEKNRNTMLENVSHELRTPLTVILGHLDILQKDQRSQEQKSYSKIRENVERMIVLTEDILKASQWKQQTLQKTNQAFNPMPSVMGVVENYQNIAKAKGIDLQLDNQLVSSQKDQEPLFLINGHEEQFYQVIQNLVDNSIKYTPSGEVELLIKKNEHSLVLNISDTGSGIEAHEKKNIFKRFYRIDKARKESGTGLGLSIVKAYLDQWASHWTVTSKPNQGTTFNIEFKIINI